jgi:hypothetical protein
MKPYELQIICDSLHLRIKDSWEQARMISYVTAQVNSKKRLRPNDLITFAWESTDQQQAQQQEPTLTMEDVKRIKKAAKEREKLLKEKGII